jgi:hypothetical protein
MLTRRWEKGIHPYALVVEMYISAISIETSMDGPQKTKNRTTL